MKESIALLSAYTTLGVGGSSRVRELTDAPTAEEVLSGASLVIGKGSNLLISDDGVDGVTVINRLRSVTVDGERIEAESGISLPSLSAIATSRGLSGFEPLSGIPGSVGGAVKMNAGAFGKSVADLIESAEVIRDGKRVVLSRDELGFSYRNSAISESDFVVKATFRLKQSSVSDIRKETRRLFLIRRERQPQGKSAGSTYLKADKPAGWYIDMAGLKGARVGGAVVSEKHANFIINDGYATARDVYELMQKIEAVVLDHFGVKLKREIKLIGEF